MPRKPGPGVRVRGTCSAGHTTEAISDAGRVTWEGKCSHKGCELAVKGRRIPGPPPAPKTEPKPDKTPAITGTTRKLIVTKEPTNAPKHPKATQQPVPGSGPAGDGTDQPPGVPAGGPGSPVGGLVVSGGDPGPHHSTSQAREGTGKWRGTLRTKLKTRRERERRTDEPDWIPGIIR